MCQWHNVEVDGNGRSAWYRQLVPEESNQPGLMWDYSTDMIRHPLAAAADPGQATALPAVMQQRSSPGRGGYTGPRNSSSPKMY